MTSTEQNLTPYDTGERLEPFPHDLHGNVAVMLGLTREQMLDRYGKVDFDTNESSTAVTAWVERDPLNPGGYVLRYYTHQPNIRVEEVTE